jgi:DNA uptake protein ComE-like DNA-binding protein
MFLAAVMALGAGTRLVASWRDEREAAQAAADPAAVQAQLRVVDSLRSQPRGSRSRRNVARRERQPPATRADSPLVVNVDYAPAEELEALPRIGPTLARRIVQDRDERGPFGSSTRCSVSRGSVRSW